MLQTKLELITSGRRLRIARLGSGTPVIFLHGYPDNLHIWSEMSMSLKYPLIYPESPGADPQPFEVGIAVLANPDGLSVPDWLEIQAIVDPQSDSSRYPCVGVLPEVKIDDHEKIIKLYIRYYTIAYTICMCWQSATASTFK